MSEQPTTPDPECAAGCACLTASDVILLSVSAAEMRTDSSRSALLPGPGPVGTAGTPTTVIWWGWGLSSLPPTPLPSPPPPLKPRLVSVIRGDGCQSENGGCSNDFWLSGRSAVAAGFSACWGPISRLIAFHFTGLGSKTHKSSKEVFLLIGRLETKVREVSRKFSFSKLRTRRRQTIHLSFASCILVVCFTVLILKVNIGLKPMCFLVFHVVCVRSSWLVNEWKWD